jgi:hypothetical protein
MGKEIAVHVSREGNITLTVPESINRLDHEKVNLIITLLMRAIDDSKQVQGLLKKIETITRPYNSEGQKVSDLQTTAPINTTATGKPSTDNVFGLISDNKLEPIKDEVA